MRLTLPALAALAWLSAQAGATVLFTDAGATVNDSSTTITSSPSWAMGAGDSGTLYFQFTIDPTSDFNTENYFAAFQFYSGGGERLGLGNNFGAFAYSAFLTDAGNLDFNSASAEPGQSFQLVRSTDTTTIVTRIDFASGATDNITVWLNPDLGVDEASQDPALTTSFTADATFDEIRLREGTNAAPAGADGWTFSNIVVADLTTDVFAIPEPSASVLLLGGLGALLRRRRR